MSPSRRAERIVQARLRMLTAANTGQKSLDEVLQVVLDETESLTGSRISFYHFLEADQETLSLQSWSTNTLPDFVAILDREHRVVRANRAMAERFNVTPEQCVGLHCYEVVHGTSVRDRGCGIQSSDINSIFEPFFTTKRAGLGMGLAICRRMVQAHGGRIWAANNEDAGATVSFSLPSTQASWEPGDA